MAYENIFTSGTRSLASYSGSKSFTDYLAPPTGETAIAQPAGNVQEEMSSNAYPIHSSFSTRNRDVISFFRFFRANWCSDHHRSSGAACLRAAGLPRRWLHLDARILGLGRRRLLLGAGHVDRSPGSRFLLDAGVLGLGRQQFCVV